MPREHAVLRCYKPSDLERLREITIEAFNGVSIDQNIEKMFGALNGVHWQELKAGNVTKDTDDNPAGIFVAEKEGEVAGYITCSADRRALSGQIINLAVDGRFRGRGLGRALIERAHEYFREEGMLYARIETLEQNDLCMAFYPRTGYREVARKVYFFQELT